jgi:hypothetical protein
MHDAPENEPAPSERLEKTRQRLAPFMAADPLSRVVEVGKGDEVEILILRPWGDKSVVLRCPDPLDELADALNPVRLPERLTAIWHGDSRELEVIWTAFNLSEAQKEISGRAFSFQFRRKTHKCEFKRSSDRLLSIAKFSVPILTGTTNHRNLQSFSAYADSKPEDRSELSLGEPLSFWIGNITWNENQVIPLVQNLNFYLSYYDDYSSTVLVHPPDSAEINNSRKIRYLIGSFPQEIRARELDENLLSFWYGAHSAEPMTKYLLYFRIIEYGSTQYLDQKVHRELRRILSVPHVNANNIDTITKIMDQLRLDKLSDSQKLNGAMTYIVNPHLIWAEIQANAAFFGKETRFDGGFKVSALHHKDDTEERFCTNGMEAFSNSIRKIRNALSHGKDMETTGVITPTTRNFQLLKPWLHLVATAAGEVVLHRGIT